MRASKIVSQIIKDVVSDEFPVWESEKEEKKTKQLILCTIGLATLLMLSGLTSVYVIVPESVDAHDIKSERQLDFHEDTSVYRYILDATPTGDSYMLWDDWGGSWSDAEKVPLDDKEGNPPPDRPGDEDDLMCWAAAASNVLEWTRWGLVSGMSNTDEIFQHFQDHWYDNGSMPEYAWHWWFDGTEIVPNSNYSFVDVPGGGNFWPTDTFTDWYQEQETPSEALEAIDTFLHDGYGVTLAIYTDADKAHAITCWGFNYDPMRARVDPDYYVGVWVTDSDDDKDQFFPPNRLRYYEVAYNSSASRWHLQNLQSSNDWYIGEVMALAAQVSGTIYIRADGSVDPPTARIQRDGDIYVLDRNVYSNAHGIVIERNNMTLDGNGHTLHGTTGFSRGIDLSYQSNVTIKNVIIRSFAQAGIYLWYSSHNVICRNSIADTSGQGISGYCSEYNDIFENNITDNRGGIYLYSETNDERNNIFGNEIARNDDFGLWLDYSSKNNVYDNEIRENTLYGGIRLRGSWGNSIFGNTIELNECGIEFTRSSYCTIHHNSFIGNTRQVYDVSWDYPTILPSVNTWNLSYPSGGNYWSDHVTVDDYSGVNQDELGSDGIVDEPNVIDENNQDNYPLTSPYEYWGNPFLGDVNKDMKVDYRDLSLLEMAYGSTPEDLNWNPNCDLNEDGKVGVSDLYELGKNYGKTA